MLLWHMEKLAYILEQAEDYSSDIVTVPADWHPTGCKHSRSTKAQQMTQNNMPQSYFDFQWKLKVETTQYFH